MKTQISMVTWYKILVCILFIGLLIASWCIYTLKNTTQEAVPPVAQQEVTSPIATRVAEPEGLGTWKSSLPSVKALMEKKYGNYDVEGSISWNDATSDIGKSNLTHFLVGNWPQFTIQQPMKLDRGACYSVVTLNDPSDPVFVNISDASGVHPIELCSQTYLKGVTYFNFKVTEDIVVASYLAGGDYEDNYIGPLFADKNCGTHAYIWDSKNHFLKEDAALSKSLGDKECESLAEYD